MAEIINHNPEDNPRLNEIYEILLLAGYFRIRISSLKAFDKVVGGIAWCITSSNFEIEVQYNDQMQIGQKIKVSEIICESLKKMNCPYTLQPFQLQGLDVNNIFPIVQWLVKFVYETRFERQKYDRQLSMILGAPLTKMQNKGNPDKLIIPQIKRSRVNKAIRKTDLYNPVRVYSALLEYNDVSATKMYNKLLNIMNHKKKNNKSQDKGQQNIIQLLGEDAQEAQEDQTNPQQTMKSFGNFNGNQTMSFGKLEQIINENKIIIEQGIKEHETEQDHIGEQKDHSDIKDQTFGSSEQQRLLKQAKIQNKKFQQKIQVLKNQLQSLQSINNQLDLDIENIKQQRRITKQKAEAQFEKNNQYREAEAQIKAQLQSSNSKINPKIQKLAEKRQLLKAKKAELKKKTKAKLDQLNYQSQLALASVPEIDEQVFKEMMQQAQAKKQIYDKKYQELTLINQQLAILQRKAENFTSAPQILQYQQRFIELFQAINILIEQKRSMYSQMTNLQSLRAVVVNYRQILSNVKTGYMELKKKNQLKEFITDMKQILQGLESNSSGSAIALEKMKSKREAVYSEYMDLIKLEREYLHSLRILKIQYENAAAYYK